MPTPKLFSFEPMLCESAERPPEGREWRYKLKLDGFRAIGRKSGRSVQLWSRNQKDITRRFPIVLKGIAELPSDAVIDGEIVALDENGRPSFNLLQRLRLRPGHSPVCIRSADAAALRATIPPPLRGLIFRNPEIG
jgi:bifunctional non-homologous end joining protein LigD